MWRFQYVASREKRSLKMPKSPPASHSVETSGLMSGFPRLSGRTPGPSVEAWGLKVVNWSNAPGCSPDSPMAARSLTELMGPTLLQPCMSLGTKERLSFG